MTDYRMDSTGLYDTGLTNRADLHFERSPGVDYPTQSVRFDLLRSLNLACNGTTVAGGPNLDTRLRTAAKAAIDAELTSQSEPTAPWSILVNDSKPDGGIWTPQTNKRFIHVIYTPDGSNTQHVAVAQQPEVPSTTTNTWCVTDVIVVEVVEGN